MQIDLKNPKEIFKNTNQKIINKIKEFLPEQLHKNSCKFIVYLINTFKKPSILLKNSPYSVVLPSNFIYNHFEGVARAKPNKPSDLDQLLELGLISRSRYDREQKLCREYKLDSLFLLKLMMFCQSENLPFLGNSKNPITMPASASRVLADNLLSVSSDLLSSILSYKYYPMLYVEKLQTYILDKFKKLFDKQSSSINPNNKKYTHAYDRLMNDYYKFIYILKHGDQQKNGTFDYTRDFIVTSTGRIVEKNGLQGISRTAKEYVYKDLPLVYNYDLKSSQLVLLSYFAKKLNINTNWIDEYVKNENAKTEYAKKVGISVEVWKKTILSLVFGSIVNKRGTPYSIILKESGNNKQIANLKYARWLDITAGMRKICKEWLTLLPAWCKLQSNRGIISNAVGIQIDFNKNNYSAKWLSAWLLQGLESAIVYKLMIFPEAAYKTIEYMFDGLITFGQIPQKIFNTVLESFDLQNSGLKLEIKPFA